MKIDKFGLMVTIWMCLFLAVVLSIILPFIATGSLTLAEFFEGFIVSFVISLVITLIIPLMEWGGRVAAACGAQPETLPWHLISTAALALIMGTLLSLIMVIYFIPPEARPFFLFIWIGMYPFALLATYIAALIAAPIGVAIAKKCCGIPG
ncbi:hypothetical protein [Methanoregula sp.]|uniref:hypothetical protein n=1 Tax=Methanoregula sp. TaxID=2052170 RepID=UPI00260D9E22|nr:hypothetical protein [Methanoregula sp.]MDD5144062.1 hypothetical protein [Methanoregula sp.]